MLFVGQYLPQIFGAVALVEDDDAVEVLSAPVQQLLQPRLVLVLRALRLPDQRRVRRVDDALAHVPVDRTVDLGVPGKQQMCNKYAMSCHDQFISTVVVCSKLAVIKRYRVTHIIGKKTSR